MWVALEVPFADTAAVDLGFSLRVAVHPALHVLNLADVAGPGSRLQLRLLGASHQVLLRTSGGILSETVACLRAGWNKLPGHTAIRTLPGARSYEFDATITRLGPEAFDTQVRALRGHADEAHSIVGEFPGVPGALTVISAEISDRRVGWWTAHAYPQARELVLTRTRVVPR